VIGADSPPEGVFGLLTGGCVIPFPLDDVTGVPAENVNI